MHSHFCDPIFLSYEIGYMFQTFINLSPLTETNYFSKGENWRSQTFFLWPDSYAKSYKFFEDHIFIVLSWLAVATNLSLGENFATFIYF